MSKIITDELIEKMLDKRGFPEDASEESILCAVQDYYDTELISDWWPDAANYWVYTETTRDGYEVFVATHNPDRIIINEDVHYYENNLAGELANAITDGGKIYVDDLDAYYVSDAVRECYDYLRHRLAEEITDELINDGYVREEETETA